MAKYFDRETIQRWAGMARSWLAANHSVDAVTNSVMTGSAAWEIAHRCGITREAYADLNVTDAHIVTALRTIFPNAEFLDTYHY